MGEHIHVQNSYEIDINDYPAIRIIKDALFKRMLELIRLILY